MFIFFIGSANASSKEKVTFSKCVDGDTIKVNIDGEINIVRMLAIDTPESVHPTKGVEYYGEEASNYTCNLVTNAKKIELEYDKNSDKKDKYNTFLGQNEPCVSVKTDVTNQKKLLIIKDSYAHSMVIISILIL